MSSLRGLIESRMACGAAAVLLFSLYPAAATAQSVRGHGEVNNGTVSPSQVSVDAWLDATGVAHGTMVWVGDVALGSLPKTGSADPWFIDVTDIVFDGDTAYVSGVVAHSVFPADVGSPVLFIFTDNSGTGAPDEINGEPIAAGNITVAD